MQPRTAAIWADFLEWVDAWLPTGADRAFANANNEGCHWATEVLLCSLAFAHWEVIFQPVYAACPNWARPVYWSPPLKGRRLEMWTDLCKAVERPTATGSSPTSGDDAGPSAYLESPQYLASAHLPDAPPNWFSARESRHPETGAKATFNQSGFLPSSP